MLTIACILTALIASQQSNQVKGQQQLAGSIVTFGTTYTLQTKFNFTLFSASYGIEAVDADNALIPTDETKVLTLTFGVKNADGGDNWLNTEGLFTFVDDKDQVYEVVGLPTLKSSGTRAPNLTLRPGQGLGIPAEKDPLSMSFLVPKKARITKIMVNQGRLQDKNEKVLRFLLTPPPKDKNAKGNFIKPLPAEIVDPADPFGAIELDAGKGTAGAFMPSGAYAIRYDGIGTPADAKYDGNEPEEGKKFVVVTISAKTLVSADYTEFDLTGGDFPKYEIVDADNEHYQPIGFRKAKADEAPSHKFIKGEPYGMRIFFALPKDAQPKKLKLGAGSSTVWLFDL